MATMLIKLLEEYTLQSKIMEVPVGDSLIGRVVDPLGRPVDGLGPINTNKKLSNQQ